MGKNSQRRVVSPLKQAIPSHLRLDQLLTDTISLLQDFPDNLSGDVNHEKLENVLNLIASKFLMEKIREDGVSLKSKYKDTTYLKTLNSKEFVRDRNRLLLSFICGAVDINFEEQTNRSFLYAIAVTIEMMYFLRNLNLILPHCFMLNLVQSFTSGSKTVTNMNGKVTPGACYTTYKSWLSEQGKHCITCPDGDLITFYDNMGKYIVKHYQIDLFTDSDTIMDYVICAMPCGISRVYENQNKQAVRCGG